MKVFFVIAFSCLLALCPPVMTQTGKGATIENTNAKVKAVYLYNFSKYIEWPEAYKSGDFVISIFGENPDLLNELNKMASLKKAGTQPFKINNPATIKDIERSHVVFVLSNSKTDLSSVVSAVEKHNTLLVAETPGATTKGAAINFVVKNERQLFEMNKANLQKYKLSVSPSLSSLAIMVE